MSEPGYKDRQALGRWKMSRGRLIYNPFARGGNVGVSGRSEDRAAKPKGKSARRAAKKARRLAREAQQ